MLEYINEAFKSLDQLNEDIFSTDTDGINNLSDFMDNDSEDDTISIIDMEADDTEDLKDSYIGKIIVDCNVCHSHIFKSRDELSITEDGLVNESEDCPYCGEQGGFVIVGEISAFNPDSESEDAAEEEPTDTDNDDFDTSDTSMQDDTSDDDPVLDNEELDESLSEAKQKYKPHTMKLLKMIGSDLVNDSELHEDMENSENNIEESFNNVSIETDDQKMTMTSDDAGKVTVTTEPISSELSQSDEMISPISEPVQDEIISDTLENSSDELDAVDDESIADEPIEDEESDVNFDIDEVEEDGLDELGESYLKRVYENVESFKTSNVSSKDNKLIIEGIITFKSGTSKNTGFIFEANSGTKDGKVKFIGENAHLCRGKKAFTLNGSINNNKLIVESLSYNYRAKNPGCQSTRVYGTVSRKV